MDHFAKRDDELAVAQRAGKLHRNFQGYSTHADCDLLAFGISAIGKVGPTYSQNVRTLDDYYDRLDADALPCFRGWQLDADDLLRRDVIQALMCQFTVDFAAIESSARHLVWRLLRAWSSTRSRRWRPTGWSSSRLTASRSRSRAGCWSVPWRWSSTATCGAADAPARYSRVI